MTPQFANMTSSSDFFDVDVFLLSRIEQKPGNWKYLRLNFDKDLGTGDS